MKLGGSWDLWGADLGFGLGLTLKFKQKKRLTYKCKAFFQNRKQLINRLTRIGRCRLRLTENSIKIDWR